MAKSFKNTALQAIANGKCPKGFPADLLPVARRKLLMVLSAAELKDLLVPPGNRLEALKGGRAGQRSVRVNDQWRVCFRWEGGRATEIEITDYH
ncbi:MAG: type II toxin-antitoxin system RelE/ParE family toxin [Candidatus Devosia euplotis]|nr:type II toxin-antitoxin system RelE/ParE family toxin [Candidatus Devosia euplotis]